jgi:plastocyanin
LTDSDRGPHDESVKFSRSLSPHASLLVVLASVLAAACGDDAASSGAGAGGGGGEGAGAGAGGGHSHTPCEQALDCPAPSGVCLEATCVDSMCGTAPVAVGTVVADAANNCRSAVCDGEGGVVEQADTTDVPVDDGNACTVEICEGTTPSTSSAQEGLACTGPGDEKVCNGGGACVECNTLDDCGDLEVCELSNCIPDSCVNAEQDGEETSVDCGGSQCNGCEDGLACLVDGDCLSGYCDQALSECATPACDDSVKNGMETGLDCGGSCGACPNGQGCAVDDDCASGYCNASNVCAAPSCNDGAKNGNETGVDCGGPCSACVDGEGCAVDGDCASGHCVELVCGPLNGCTRATSLDATSQTAVTIDFGSFFYDPPCLRVSAGTTVTFSGSFSAHPLIGGYVNNNMANPAAQGPFLPMVNSGTSASFGLDAVGTFPYYCVFHPGQMSGTIYVEN